MAKSPSADADFLRRYTEAQGDLQAFVRSVLRDPQAADDCLQETALVLWRRFADYDPSKGTFTGWARGIAAMVMRSMRSRRARQPTMLQLQPETIEAVAQAWEGQTSDSEHLLALESCLQRFSKDQQQMIHLRYVDGIPNHEIAERTGRALPGVTKALQRLRQALVECVQGRLRSPEAEVP